MSLRSKYDYEGMSNVEKYAGRALHNQDVSWFFAKILMLVSIAWVIYLAKSGDLDFEGVKAFFNYLR